MEYSIENLFRSKIAARAAQFYSANAAVDRLTLACRITIASGDLCHAMIFQRKGSDREPQHITNYHLVPALSLSDYFIISFECLISKKQSITVMELAETGPACFHPIISNIDYEV